jgi:large subunit ribosomal protein L24
MKKVKLKKGDKIVVLSGNSKGHTGEVIKILPEIGKIIVRSDDSAKPVRVIKKHTKPNAQSPQGGIKELDAPIYISKVAFLDPTTKSATKLGYKIENGKSIRISKKSGNPV